MWETPTPLPEPGFVPAFPGPDMGDFTVNAAEWAVQSWNSFIPDEMILLLQVALLLFILIGGIVLVINQLRES
jgi:hypothetical protein